MARNMFSLKFDTKAFEKDFKRTCSLEISLQSGNLKKVAQVIIDRSNARIPRVTGTLLGSAYIGKMDSGDTPRLRVGYGGPKDKLNPITGRKASEYVMYVHENLSAVHPVGQAKFLELAVLEVAPNIESILASFKRR